MPLTPVQKKSIIGGSILLFSIILQTTIGPAIVKAAIKKKAVLNEGGMMREIWSKYPFSLEFHVYAFNVTNPDEIKTGAKPVIQEVGPFVYDDWLEKVELLDHEEDDTVSYSTKSTFYFNKEKSKDHSDEEELILPHIFALGLINTALREKPSAMPVLGKGLDSILKKPDNVFVRMKVKDLLFDGLIVDCNVVDFAGSAVCSEIKNNYEKFNLKVVGQNLYSASIFGGANGTDKARTRVYRGNKNLMDLGKVVEYDNKPNMSVWQDDYCDAFNGTDGTIFPPLMDKKGKDDVVAFNPRLCRSISCYFHSKTKASGIKALRYTTDLGIDGDNVPRHKCYCPAPNNCPKKGLYDTYKCTSVPLIITNPHFYLVDEYYLQLVDGLTPNQEKHMLILDIDPVTGIPINVHKRAQFNMFIHKIDKLKLLKKFPDALLPILWIDEIVNLPDDLLKEIKSGHNLILLFEIFKCFSFIGAFATLALAVGQYYKSKHNNNGQGQKLNHNNNIANKMDISAISGAPLPLNVD